MVSIEIDNWDKIVSFICRETGTKMFENNLSLSKSPATFCVLVALIMIIGGADLLFLPIYVVHSEMYSATSY